MGGQLWWVKCLSGNPPNFAFLLCAYSSVVAMWKINSLCKNAPCGFLVKKIVIFRPFAHGRICTKFDSRRSRRRNHLYQFFGDRLRSVDSVGSKIAISHWQGQSPLTPTGVSPRFSDGRRNKCTCRVTANVNIWLSVCGSTNDMNSVDRESLSLSIYLL